jgi:hypothetical protein
MSTSASSAYQVRVAEPEDLPRILELWHGMSSTRVQDVVEQRRSWLYERNPVGPAVTWVVVEPTTRDVVACATAFPRRLRVGERTLTAGLLADFLVSPRHRIGGPALMVQRTLAAQSRSFGFSFLFGYPNHKALPIFKRLEDFRIVAQSSAWLKPLRLRAGLEKLIGPRLPKAWSATLREGVAQTAAGVAALAGDRMVPVVDWLRGLRVPSATLPLLTRRADAIGRELPAFPAPRTRIVGARDQAYLDWRYAEYTTAQCEMFSVSHAAHAEALGLVVFRRDGACAHILDASWGDGPDAAAVLFAAFLRTLRKDGVHEVRAAYVGARQVKDLLRRFGFIERPSKRCLVAYVEPQSESWLSEAVLSEESWALFDGELDI